VPNIISSVVRFNNIYISIFSRGVLILGEVLLRVLLRVIISKGEFSLDIFSID